MSAVRALRQLATCSSRTLGARTFTRAALPALRVAVATTPANGVNGVNAANVAKRAFSVSARRFGEGACESIIRFSTRGVVILTGVNLGECSGRRAGPEARRGAEVREGGGAGGRARVLDCVQGARRVEGACFFVRSIARSHRSSACD